MLRITASRRQYDRPVEYEESYYGRRIVVTTEPAEKGAWTSRAELLDDEGRVSSTAEVGRQFASEDDALRAALSAAAGVIDRARTSRGKPSA
jgi:hypothetical protein